MFLELFVISMCVSGLECQKSPQAYYLFNKDFQESVERHKTIIENAVGPIMVNYFIPYIVAIGMAGSGQTGTVNVTQNISIYGNTSKGEIGITFTLLK